MARSRSLVVLAVLLTVLGGFSLAGARLVPTETTVTELAPGVWFRKTETQPAFIGCNQSWVEFKDFVLVIDANFPGQAQQVIELIRKQTDKPIRYVFDTHYHGDHADGNAHYTRAGATAVAAERAKIEFETKGAAGFEQQQESKPDEYGGLEYGVPALYFPEKLVLDDGTQRVELIHFGHGHTLGDAVAWLPEHGILFTGDACVNGAFNYMGDGDTASWIACLGAMQELPVKQVAPGHGELAGAELLETQKRYFVELRSEVQKLIDAGRTLDQIKQELDLPWYQQWAGKDVKDNTENIETVYKELTAGKPQE
jgi:glyoxylase-like metal-dependent hydrolase (beta-lactamase superfamily II)